MLKTETLIDLATNNVTTVDWQAEFTRVVTDMAGEREALVAEIASQSASIEALHQELRDAQQCDNSLEGKLADLARDLRKQSGDYVSVSLDVDAYKSGVLSVNYVIYSAHTARTVTCKTLEGAVSKFLQELSDLNAAMESVRAEKPAAEGVLSSGQRDAFNSLASTAVDGTVSLPSTEAMQGVPVHEANVAAVPCEINDVPQADPDPEHLPDESDLIHDENVERDATPRMPDAEPL